MRAWAPLLLMAIIGSTCAYVAIAFVPVEVTSVLLTAFGSVGAVCTALMFQALSRRKDILTLKPLPDWHQDRLEEALGRCQRRLQRSWWLGFLFGLAAIVLGNLLKVTFLSQFRTPLTFAGYISGAITLYSAAAILLDYRALTDTWDIMRRRLKEQERERAFYEDAKL